MGGIVCAVRGGPDSRPTIDKAIQLARETNLKVSFLYVVNLDFMSHTSSSRVHTLLKDMDQMGEFILLQVQEEAAAKGVEAEGLIRHGNVADEIAGFCHEIGADYLILGLPQIKEERSVFTETKLNRLIERIEAQTGAKVVLAEEGAQV